MDAFSPTNSEPMNVCENHEYSTPDNCNAGISQYQNIAKDPDHRKCPELVGGIKESYIAYNHSRTSQLNSRKKRAAVLLCIFEGLQGELRVILTKRSMNLSTHPGEVALPGGKMDELDADDRATALREAMEEIGLAPNLVQVVATLEPFISSHLLIVVPVVGILTRVEEFKPVLNASEVDANFDVPQEIFLKVDGYRCLERQWEGCEYVSHLFDYKSFEPDQETFVIGGLTASILIRAASIIYQRSPSLTQLLPDFTQLQRTLHPLLL